MDYIYLALILAGVCFVAYLWLEKNNAYDDKSSKIERPNSISGAAFSLKMQAYERLALFLERSKPQSLIMRFLNDKNTVAELQMLLLVTIRQEFEHNFSQQIYVSENLWQSITFAKDKLIQIINKAEKGNSLKEFSEELLLQYSKEEDFIGNTLFLLRNEARISQK